jgi:ribosome-associated toxin RatA of RatAB toxin-antitoxin module
MTLWQISGNQFDFSIAHSISASKDVVYQVLADMEAYPEFVSDLISVKREGDLYKFVARAAILTIPAAVTVTKTPGRSIDFEMVDGPVDVLSGSWLIEDADTPEQTKVVLTIHGETTNQGEWLLRMTGKYVQNKTDKLIAAFSERVAELQRSGGVPVVLLEKAETDGLVAWFKRLWSRIFGRPAARAPMLPRSTKPASTLFRDETHSQTLEALAVTLLPADSLDEGVRDMGFAGVVEMRSRYEVGRTQLYTAALEAVDQMAETMFSQPGFADLTFSERTMLLEAVRQDRINGELWGQVKPSAFFDALWEDVVFLYCTHPDTWLRIGFPGPSFEAGGYRDFDQPQEFIGETN